MLLLVALPATSNSGCCYAQFALSLDEMDEDLALSVNYKFPALFSTIFLSSSVFLIPSSTMHIMPGYSNVKGDNWVRDIFQCLNAIYLLMHALGFNRTNLSAVLASILVRRTPSNASPERSSIPRENTQQ